MKNYKFKINDNSYSVDIVDIEEQVATVEVNGTSYKVALEMEVCKPVSAPKPVTKVAVTSAPQTATAPAPKAPTSAGGNMIKSPLPGTVLDIYVKPGDVVKQGQNIVKLEAMKMENNIDAEHDGIVKDIRVQKNDIVMEGDVLIVFE